VPMEVVNPGGSIRICGDVRSDHETFQAFYSLC
jgi:hypothetical protein